MNAAVRTLENLLGPSTGWRGHLLRAGLVTLAFAVFLVAAFSEQHFGLARAVRFNDPIILLLVAALLFLAYRPKGRLGILTALCATLLLFGLDLAGVWVTPESGGSMVIGGLLPWSDALEYFRGAQLLNAGGQLDAWHGRRPWFVALLSVLWGATAGNLQWSIAVLVATTATACFLLARAIHTSHGRAAAVVGLMILWIFYSRFIGLTLSEHTGLALGAAATAGLWEGSRQPRLGPLWFGGLFLLTCALAARAGAFLVLPTLLAWGAVRSYAASPRESLRVLVMGAAAIGSAFMLDFALRHALVPEAVPFGNFSHVFYGVVVGNKGWSRILYDHPELLRLGEAAADKRAYQLALEALRANPAIAVSGILGTWRHFFSQGYGAFSFIPNGDVRLTVMILSGLGFCYCLLKWRTATYSMILAMVAGVFLSVPFVPPVDSMFMRVYAATIPITAVLAGLGAGALFSLRRANVSPPPEHLPPGIANCVGGFLVFATFAGALAIRLLGAPAAVGPGTCPAGLSTLYVRLTEGSSIRLVPDEARPRSHVPDVRISDFKEGLDAFRENYLGLYAKLEKMQAGRELRFTINLAPQRYGERLWLVSDTQLTPRSGMAQVCAEPLGTVSRNHLNSYYLRDHDVYYAREFRLLE